MIIDEETCEACGNTVRTYSRRMPKGDLRALMTLYKKCREGDSWVHVSELPLSSGKNLHSFRHYGLIERRPRPEGGWWSGFWRMTELGRRFVTGKAVVRARWLDREGVCVGMDGHSVNIQEIWQSAGFSYHELMQWVGEAYQPELFH